MMFMREQTFGTVATWMWRLVTTMSSYDKELVTGSMVEEGTDPGTNFLVAVAFRSRSTAMTCSSSRS
jgi:hypothetical protein